MNEVLKKINKAKLRLMVEKNTTFFSALLASLKLTEEPRIPTAATDGISLFYNAEYIEPLDNDELTGLLLHEVMHVALDHINRCKNKQLDSQLYNIAGDYYINNDLDHRGYVLPEGALIDHSYTGWSTQQIYEYLDKNAVEVEFEMDILPPPDGMSEEEHKEKVISNVVRAATQARLNNDPGSIPGEIQRKLDELLNPKLPWNVILQNYMSNYAKDDYSWKRPNRRLWPDLYLPSLHSQSLGQVTVGIDVSASIDQKQLRDFVSEVRYIWETMKPEKIRIMAFDTAVRTNVLLNEGDEVKDVKWLGGGGTNLKPLITSIKKEQPVFALIFSDFEVAMPDLSGIESDLYWIRIGKATWQPSQGEVIDLE